MLQNLLQQLQAICSSYQLIYTVKKSVMVKATQISVIYHLNFTTDFTVMPHSLVHNCTRTWTCIKIWHKKACI